MEQENEEKQEEELPVLTAQRFLNIFRQIHIFSDRKKKQFDAELLSLSSEVIKSLSSLPGSSLLLDHIDELKGISPEDGGLIEVKQKPQRGNINKASETDEAAERPTEEKIVAPMFNVAQGQAPIQFPVFDNSFSDNLTAALSLALEKLESKHNREMSQLMNSVMETLKVVADKKEAPITVQAPVENNLNTESVAELVRDVMSAQTQMFSQAVSEQTKAIAEMISDSLKNQKPYIIEKVIQEKQPIVQMTSNKTNDYDVAQDELKADDFDNESIPEIEETNDSAINLDDFADIAPENDAKNDLSNLLDEQEELVYQESKKKKKNKKKKNKDKSEAESDINSIADITGKNDQEVQASVAPAVVLDDIKNSVNNEEAVRQDADDQEWSWDKLDDIQASIEKDAQERAENSNTEVVEPEEVLPEEDASDDAVPGIVNELIDLDDNSRKENNGDSIVDFFDEVNNQDEYSDENPETYTENNEDEKLSSENEDYDYWENELVNEVPSEENQNSTNQYTEEFADTQNDGYEQASSDMSIDDNSAQNSDDEYNFDTSDFSDDTSAGSQNDEYAFDASAFSDDTLDNSQNDEYSFDANDFSMSENQENTEEDQTADYAETSAENPDSNDEGEWEWEYEEVPEGEDTNSEEGGDDWEWEYEEVPDDGTGGEQSSDGDWEWEYEEDNDNNKK